MNKDKEKSMVNNMRQKKYNNARNVVDGRRLETARLSDGSLIIVTHKTQTHVYGEVVPTGTPVTSIQLLERTPATVFVPLARVKVWNTVAVPTSGNGNRHTSKRV